MMLNIGPGYGADKEQALTINCEDYEWSDVEYMVQDYMDDMLHTALVMQGLSSNYDVTTAAIQAMVEPEVFPVYLRRELQAIIDAGC